MLAQRQGPEHVEPEYKKCLALLPVMNFEGSKIHPDAVSPLKEFLKTREDEAKSTKRESLLALEDEKKEYFQLISPDTSFRQRENDSVSEHHSKEIVKPDQVVLDLPSAVHPKSPNETFNLLGAGDLSHNQAKDGEKIISAKEPSKFAPAGKSQIPAKISTQYLLHLMYLKEKHKHLTQKNTRRSVLLLRDLIAKVNKEVVKGKRYFLMANHELASIFVKDSLFNTRKERLTIYISSLMSQFFTSTSFYNSKVENEELEDERQCLTVSCILLDSITGMTMRDVAMVAVNNLLTLPLVIACGFFMARKYVIRDKEDRVNVGAFKSNLKKMSIKAFVGSSMLYAYSAFCIYAVAQFSAHREKDTDVAVWLLTFIFSGFADIFLKQPLIASIKIFVYKILVRTHYTPNENIERVVNA
eukprot:TRINITY_DN1603_c0_g2_i3.p1 TRINITY_DN1603_c0_g2~~TRINITY_DN1603_c0_g2_i3.p1  ORF type:complete len:414 (+),score=74.34 TRINITY_DN1603_c0_g2_i3:164-1405(+)